MRKRPEGSYISFKILQTDKEMGHNHAELVLTYVLNTRFEIWPESGRENSFKTTIKY